MGCQFQDLKTGSIKKFRSIIVLKYNRSKNFVLHPQRHTHPDLGHGSPQINNTLFMQAQNFILVQQQ